LTRVGFAIIFSVMEVEILSIEYLDDISPPSELRELTIDLSTVPAIESPTLEDDIVGLMGRMKGRCDECGCYRFYRLQKWKDRMLCYRCVSPLRDAYTAEITSYMNEKGYTKCKFCQAPRDSVSGFHFDHLNMFDKRDSVGCMAMRGDNIEFIKEEIEKCQLLCVSCHAIITRIETKFGFTKEKILCNKGKGDVEVLRKKYDEFMTECYRIVAEAVRGLGSIEV
jgi:hypothetical protein